jgi:hypothetical protein
VSRLIGARDFPDTANSVRGSGGGSQPFEWTPRVPGTPAARRRSRARNRRRAGMIKSSPQKIIAEGTDWRYLNEVKRELKA